MTNSYTLDFYVKQSPPSSEKKITETLGEEMKSIHDKIIANVTTLQKLCKQNPDTAYKVTVSCCISMTRQELTIFTLKLQKIFQAKSVSTKKNDDPNPSNNPTFEGMNLSTYQ